MLERFLQVVPSWTGCEGFAEGSQINSTEETPQEEKDTISQRHVDSTGNYCAGKNRAKEVAIVQKTLLPVYFYRNFAQKARSND